MADTRFVNEVPWKGLEDRVARRTSTPLLPSDQFEAQALSREIAASQFTEEEISALSLDEPDLLTRFACAWILHNRGIDYGEEWDPDEGDQQPTDDRNPTGRTFVRGFLVTSAIMLLYAGRAPDRLHAYLVARRIPKAKRVRDDVVRLYELVRR